MKQEGHSVKDRRCERQATVCVKVNESYWLKGEKEGGRKVGGGTRKRRKELKKGACQQESDKSDR